MFEDMKLDILFLVIVVIVLFSVAKIENYNGRVQLCKEIGFYPVNGECLDRLEYNQKYNNSQKLNIPSMEFVNEVS